MKSADWIIAHDGTQGDDAYALECLRCGSKQRFSTPISITVYCAAAKAFEHEHRHCRVQEKPKGLIV